MRAETFARKAMPTVRQRSSEQCSMLILARIQQPPCSRLRLNDIAQVHAAALSAAAARGQASSVSSLLAAGASPNGTSREPPPVPPLHAACLHGRAECAALLLAAGADVNRLDRRGRTAADCALEADHAACLGALLDDSKLTSSYTTAEGDGLVTAAAAGALGCMEELLRRGGDPRTAVRAADGTTALAAACAHGRRGAAEWLLLRGANPNERGVSRSGRVAAPAIITAVCCGHADCAALLLDHGARGNVAAAPRRRRRASQRVVG